MAAPVITHQTPPPTGGRLVGALRSLLRIVLRGVLLDPIAEGRLRRVGWPIGWPAVIGIGYLGFVLACGLVLTAPLWRSGRLAEVAEADGLLPRATVWLLAWLLITVAALFHLGAVHSVWWAKIGSLLIMVGVIMTWMATLVGIGHPLAVLPASLAAIALIVFSVLRMGASPSWWEFAVYWALLAVPAVMTMIINRQQALLLGFDFPPLVIAQLISLLAVICAPVAVAAGTATAEITVSLTVWSAVAAGKVSRRRVLLALLLIAFAVRAVQTVRELIARDWGGPTGLVDLAPVGIAMILFAGVSLLLIRLADGRIPQVTELPENLNRLAMPVGAALLGVLLPYQLLLLGVQLWVSVTARPVTGPVWTLLSGDEAAGMVRGVLAVLLLVLAVRAARRGRIATALLEAHIAVLLLPRPLSAIIGPRFSIWPDQDLINLLITTVAVAVLIIFGVRRTLTPARMVGLGAVAVLGGLFSGREVLLAPFSTVLGPSAALLLVGLCWTLLTGCQGANVDGRWFPARSRAVMVVGFVLLATVVLAFVTLSGTGGGSELDIAETVGDEILGTALLTATVTSLLVLLRRGDSPS